MKNFWEVVIGALLGLVHGALAIGSLSSVAFIAAPLSVGVALVSFQILPRGTQIRRGSFLFSLGLVPCVLLTWGFFEDPSAWFYAVLAGMSLALMVAGILKMTRIPRK